jgi:acetoin utilization deacetylase AcuC-like enzyme
VLIYTHEDCLAHEVPEGHPERPERLAFLMGHLERTGFLQDHSLQVAPSLPRELIETAHSSALYDQLENAIPERGISALDPDTWVGPHSLSASCHAAGAVWQGVNDVVLGDQTRVFCAVRPPGHHAEQAAAMGFCLLNSVAIAAVNALSLAAIDRVAVLDFDVHHGNGTVDICRHDPRILVCSSFQHPFYPGRMHEISQNNIVNTPLSAGASGDDFRRAVAASWWPTIEAHRPDLILISAGFDGHKLDDIAQLNLSEPDYQWVTEEIAALADQYAAGRVVSALEGGYHFEALASSTLVHLEGLS